MNKDRRQGNNNSPIESRHASPRKLVVISSVGLVLAGLATYAVDKKISPEEPYCGVVFEVGPNDRGKQEAMLNEVEEIKKNNGITESNFGTTDLNYRSYETKPVGDTKDFTQSGDQGIMPLTEGECKQVVNDKTVTIPWSSVVDKERIADLNNTAVE